LITTLSAKVDKTPLDEEGMGYQDATEWKRI
jgi:hypothetical protein